MFVIKVTNFAGDVLYLRGFTRRKGGFLVGTREHVVEFGTRELAEKVIATLRPRVSETKFTVEPA